MSSLKSYTLLGGPTRLQLESLKTYWYLFIFLAKSRLVNRIQIASVRLKTYKVLIATTEPYKTWPRIQLTSRAIIPERLVNWIPAQVWSSKTHDQ